MELTLRTPAALGALRAIRVKVPDMLAGVGTVLTTENIAQCRDAGAAFAVAPGLNRRVVEAAIDAGFSFAPGVVTPSDMELAIELGCRLLKFFPAEPSGGLAYLKSMAAPYQHLGIEFIPLGGVNTSNMLSYLADPFITAVGGSWIATRDLIRQREWKAITERASQARAMMDQMKRSG